MKCLGAAPYQYHSPGAGECLLFRVLIGPPGSAWAERTVIGMDNRNEIRDFLVSRRARITPEQAGLPAYGGHRRVAGLRREEVALLAGVSVDYYTRLERGNAHGASEGVLEAIVRALQLDEAERAHLFDKRLHHPVVGDLTLTFEALDVAADEGLRISAYTAEPGTPTDDALNLLASWAATVDQAETARATEGA